MPSTLRTAATALAGAVAVSAHGYATGLVANGVFFEGYDVNSAPYAPEPPVVIGWGTTATDQGFVGPESFGSPDIICHRDGSNAAGHATVAAGDSVFIQWNTWPESHKGPVIDYLASCGDEGCESVDKTTLKFFKIAEAGAVDPSSNVFASDELIEQMGWMAKIPEDLAPGNYVLRHEIIALHSGGQENGAQNYPQCFNLQVTGSGSSQPEGVLGTELYKADDAGIFFSIYGSYDSYPIPGPELPAAFPAIEQGTSAIAETGTATVGSGSAPTEAPEADPTSVADEPVATPTTTAADEAEATPTSAEGPAKTNDDSQPEPTVAPPATTTSSTPEQPAETSAPVCRRKAKRSKKTKRTVRK